MKKNFNVPNTLSVIRIIFVPLIVWIYFDERIQNNTLIAAVLVVLASLTDVIDGFIARHFNIITDLGKILDPIADKLLQFSLAICISVSHPIMWWIVGLIFTKEFLTLIGTILFVNKVKITPQAKWWGKLATVVIFFTLLTFLIGDVFFETSPLLNDIQVVTVSLSIAALAFSFFNYLLFYIDGRKKSKMTSLTNESENSANDETM